MTKVSELLAMVEAATGPDRELDATIHLALVGHQSHHTKADIDFAQVNGAAALYDRLQSKIGGIDWRLCVMGDSRADPWFGIKIYTASIDAALTLVEKVLPDWFYEISNWPPLPECTLSDHIAINRVTGEGRTAPLAILAALLRATALTRLTLEHGGGDE